MKKGLKEKPHGKTVHREDFKHNDGIKWLQDFLTENGLRLSIKYTNETPTDRRGEIWVRRVRQETCGAARQIEDDERTLCSFVDGDGKMGV